MILQDILKRYHSIVLYAVFGALTTAVNAGIYYLCFHSLSIPNLFSTAIAWFVSVLFAFITNKLWVFESKCFSKKILGQELLSFFSCRILTGLLDLGIMYIAVDSLSQNEMLWKLLSNVIVIVLNYVASKLLVFKNNHSK